MKLAFKRLFSYVPTDLPVGLPQYNAWLNSIVELAGPIADEASIKWVISNEVMRMNSSRSRAAKNTFVRILRKYAANQLAAHTVNVLKAEEDAKRAASQAAQLQKAEVPAAETTLSGQGSQAN